MYGPLGLLAAVRQKRPFWRNYIFSKKKLNWHLIFIHQLPAMAKCWHTNSQLLSWGSLRNIIMRFSLQRLMYSCTPGRATRRWCHWRWSCDLDFLSTPNHPPFTPLFYPPILFLCTKCTGPTEGINVLSKYNIHPFFPVKRVPQKRTNEYFCATDTLIQSRY